MNTKKQIINEIEQIPDRFLEEVLDFVHFLKSKRIKENKQITLASESSLGKDWLKPEEEQAWQNL